MVPSALSTSQLFASLNAASTPETNQATSLDTVAPAQPFSDLLDAPLVLPTDSAAPISTLLPTTQPAVEPLDAILTQPREDSVNDGELAINPLALELASLGLSSADAPNVSFVDGNDVNGNDVDGNEVATKEIVSEATPPIIDVNVNATISSASQPNPIHSQNRLAPTQDLSKDLKNRPTSVASPRQQETIQSGQSLPKQSASTAAETTAADPLLSSNPIELGESLAPPAESASRGSRLQEPDVNASQSSISNGPRPLAEPPEAAAIQSDLQGPNTHIESTGSNINESIQPRQTRSNDVAVSPATRDESLLESSLPTTLEPTAAAAAPAATTQEGTVSTAQYAEAVSSGIAVQNNKKNTPQVGNKNDLDGTVPPVENSDGSAEAPVRRVTGQSATTQSENDSTATSQESDFNRQRFDSAARPTQTQTVVQADADPSATLEFPFAERFATESPVAESITAVDPNIAAQSNALVGNDVAPPTNRVSQASFTDASGLVAGAGYPRTMDVTAQAAAAVASVIESADGKSKTMSFNLEPADLGKLTIQITQSGEAIAAQIIASELASSDLIAAQKETLQAALSELGFEDASVDVRHDNQANRDDNAQTSRQNPTQAIPLATHKIVTSQSPHSSSNGLDIVA